MAVEPDNMSNRVPILDAGAHNGFFIKLDHPPLNIHRSKIACQQILRRILQCVPGKRFELLMQHSNRCCCVIDMLSRIKRIEGVACGHTTINIFRGLQMIGVSSKAGAPALGKDSPHGIIKYLLWTAPGTGHLANGLLCGNRRDMPTCFSQSAQVSWSGYPKAIPKTSACSKSKCDWLQPGKLTTQGCGITTFKRSNQHCLCTILACLSYELV